MKKPMFYSCGNILLLGEIEFLSRERNFVFNDLLLLFVICNIHASCWNLLFDIK